MPRLDGTGPQGKGPRTGRGLGPCNLTIGTKVIKVRTKDNMNYTYLECDETLTDVDVRKMIDTLNGKINNQKTVMLYVDTVCIASDNIKSVYVTTI